ncbi:hypothetical protein D3C77_546610 [compost metagenome]
MLAGGLDVSCKRCEQALLRGLPFAALALAQQGLLLQRVDAIEQALLLFTQGGFVRMARADGLLQGVEVAHELADHLLIGRDHLAVGRIVELPQHALQQALQFGQGRADPAPALVVRQHPVGDALGTQVLAQVVDRGNLGEALRAVDGFVQCMPAAQGGRQRQQQDAGKSQGQLEPDAQVAKHPVQRCEHDGSPVK